MSRCQMGLTSARQRSVQSSVFGATRVSSGRLSAMTDRPAGALGVGRQADQYLAVAHPHALGGHRFTGEQGDLQHQRLAERGQAPDLGVDTPVEAEVQEPIDSREARQGAGVEVR